MRGLKNPIEDPLRPCLQGGRGTLVQWLPQQEGHLLCLHDMFTRQIGLLWTSRVTLIEC